MNFIVNSLLLKDYIFICSTLNIDTLLSVYLAILFYGSSIEARTKHILFILICNLYQGHYKAQESRLKKPYYFPRNHGPDPPYVAVFPDPLVADSLKSARENSSALESRVTKARPALMSLPPPPLHLPLPLPHAVTFAFLIKAITQSSQKTSG